MRLDAALVPPQLQGTHLKMAPMSAAAARAPGAALGELAEGIASLGKPFRKLAENVQEVKNAGDQSRVLNEWQDGAARVRAENAADPDPASRTRRMGEFLDGALAAVQSSELTPVVRQELELRHQDFAHRMRVDNAAAISRSVHQESVRSLATEMENATRHRDRAGFDAAMGRATAARLIDAEQQARLRAGYERTTARETLEERLMHDPRGVARELEAKGADGLYQHHMPLDDDTRRDLLEKAGIRGEELRTDRFNEVKAAMDGSGKAVDWPGVAAVMPEADVRALAEYKAARGRPLPAGAVSGTWSAVGSLYEKFLDPEVGREVYARSFNDTRTALLRTQPRGRDAEMERVLDHLSPGSRGKREASLERMTPQDLELEGTLAYKRYLDEGAFGDLLGTPEAARAAENRFRMWCSDLTTAVRGGRVKSYPEVQAHVERSIAGRRVASMVSTFSPFVSGSGQMAFKPGAPASMLRVSQSNPTSH
ncbi:hypothetical protein llg_26670 [Luteolibacter sp. LG18]|nr:hypothetical protein llg_26670 [Luteolibacter sp. LG18]